MFLPLYKYTRLQELSRQVAHFLRYILIIFLLFLVLDFPLFHNTNAAEGSMHYNHQNHTREFTKWNGSWVLLTQTVPVHSHLNYYLNNNNNCSV